jgi:hypothetical protein
VFVSINKQANLKKKNKYNHTYGVYKPDVKKSTFYFKLRSVGSNTYLYPVPDSAMMMKMYQSLPGIEGR